MAGRFVRASKYRHVFGQPTRKEQCYDNLHISKNAWDTNLVKVNPQYLSVNWDASGGGAFAVIPLEERGKLPERIPLFRGHTAVVLDTDWNPFNDSIIASASDDAKAFIWRVPDNFTLYSDDDEVKDVEPVVKLSGHTRKIGHLSFNPAAENILATSSGDYTLKIWDIENAKAALTLKHPDMMQSLSWSADGSYIVTTSRDKKLRIWDTRQEKPVHEGMGHAGAKTSRAVWMGELDRIATTGFSKMSDRQLGLWDFRAAREPIGGFTLLDSISGVCMPFWDEGNRILYLAGKGDGNIRYYEYENDAFEYLSQYQSADPQRGIAFMPKRGVDIHNNEVTRAFKTVNDNYIEPISFIVPRRAEVFQSDIYPPTAGNKPGVSASEWLSGKTALPPKIDLESVYNGEAPKHVPSDYKPTPTPTTSAAPPQTAEKKEPAPRAASPVKETAAPVQSTTTVKPPVSMKEQGAAVSNMINKYADNKDDEDSSSDDAETSSFEEVPQPVERPGKISASGPDASRELPARDASGSSAAVAAANAASAFTPAAGSSSGASTSATPTTTAPTPTPQHVVAALDRFGKIIRQQQIALEAQSKLVADLAAEVQQLKTQLNQ